MSHVQVRQETFHVRIEFRGTWMMGNLKVFGTVGAVDLGHEGISSRGRLVVARRCLVRMEVYVCRCEQIYVDGSLMRKEDESMRSRNSG